MYIFKRNGEKEDVKFEKIHQRIKAQAKGLNVDVDIIVQKAIERMFDGIKTKEIDEHLASIAVNYSVHPNYSVLAGRIAVSSLHKETKINQVIDSEKDKIAKELKNKDLDQEHKYIIQIKKSLFEDPKREEILERYLAREKVKDSEIDYLVETPRFYYVVKSLHDQGILSDELLKTVEKHRDEIEQKIDYTRDFMFDYFGFKTLEKAYLLKKHTNYIDKKPILDENQQPTGEFTTITKTRSEILERPQDMFMRVALGILGDDLEKAFDLYDLMSQGFYTHATPTLFNSGTRRPQMSSCFLLQNNDDSIEGLFHTFLEEALISKNAGGIGVSFHDVRSKGSIIKGTNGVSDGIIPFLRIKNQVAKGVNQGGKRNGSIAVYLEPWHADIKQFIQLRKNNGDEDLRARDLFLAIWMNDLFYKRVIEGGKWTLFDPAKAKGLSEVYGEEFEILYKKYEDQGLAHEVLDAREFMKDIFESLIETGNPYIVNKDQANLKSNQKNLGPIKQSNLCTEIIEFTSKDETAVCNLGSICLPKFVVEKNDKKVFDFDLFHSVVRRMTHNLNRVIDKNYYVNEKTRRSNMRHRPIGIGVQGLADVFFMLEMPYGSEESKQLNKDIFETIYHAALTESLEMAKKDGHYPSMNENGGAPITKGILQFDMWGVTPSDRYDWDKLKEKIMKYGLRNSLLVAPMPTASTSQIFGNTESFEPLTENLYKRKTLAGEFTVVNKYLILKLEELNLWNRDVLEHLIKTNGSIKDLEYIPKNIRDVFRTVWETSLKDQIDMAADRGAYICQSQSFNIHMEVPSMEKMKDVYLYSYKKGLKTQSYYFRTQAATSNQKVTVSRDVTKNPEDKPAEDDDCMVCSS